MSNSYALLVTPCPWRTCRSTLKLEVSRPPSQMEYLQLDRVECNLKRENVYIMSARRKDGKGVKQGIFRSSTQWFWQIVFCEDTTARYFFTDCACTRAYILYQPSPYLRGHCIDTETHLTY